MDLGIALSGGGVRCAAHAAIIQELGKEGIVPSVYSGTSGGALVAALLGAGIKPSGIMEIVQRTPVLTALKPAFSRGGLLDIKKTLSFFTKYLPATFEELEFPLTIGTTNMNSGQTEYFSSGPLIEPLLATCCMPVIFKPVSINGQLYVDGGLLDNMPAGPIRESCAKVIGVNTNPVGRIDTGMNMKTLLERTFLLTINANVAQRKQLCDVYLEPDCLKGLKVFDLKKINTIFENTRTWTRQQLPAIKEQLS